MHLCEVKQEGEKHLRKLVLVSRSLIIILLLKPCKPSLIEVNVCLEKI